MTPFFADTFMAFFLHRYTDMQELRLTGALCLGAEALSIGLAAGLCIGFLRLICGWTPHLLAGLLHAPLPAPLTFLCAGLFIGLCACTAFWCMKKEPLVAGSGIPQVECALAGVLPLPWLRVLLCKFLGTLRNVYNFFVLYSNQDDVNMSEMKVDYDKRPELDRWILSKYNRLIRDVTEYMDSYDHMKTVRAITEFVSEDLSNWYIRRARRRFYSEEMTEDKRSVYATTYEVLVGTAKLIAPVAPFISDEIYTKLTGEETVHTAYFPECNESLLDEKVEERMDLVRSLVALGRGTREKERIKVRQPLSEIMVDGKYRPVIEDLADLIKEELNVREVVFADKLDEFMNFSLKPDFKVAGPVLGSKIKLLAGALAKADAAALTAELEAKGSVEMDLDGEKFDIKREYVDVRISAKEGFAVAMENNVFTILDTTITPELAREGLARELISKVQQMRKQEDFEMMDNIRIFVDADEDVKAAIDVYGDYIRKETLAVSIEERDGLEKYDLNGHKTGIGVERI